jgi:hypothetical protein
MNSSMHGKMWGDAFAGFYLLHKNTVYDHENEAASGLQNNHIRGVMATGGGVNNQYSRRTTKLAC